MDYLDFGYLSKPFGCRWATTKGYREGCSSGYNTTDIAFNPVFAFTRWPGSEVIIAGIRREASYSFILRDLTEFYILRKLDFVICVITDVDI